MFNSELFRITNQPCLVNVTAGPGAINTINGVFGAFVDSLPMFVVSGQSKRETLVVNSQVEGLRQLGDQEVNIIQMIEGVCKSSILLQDPLRIHQVINNLFSISISGRPGPVWLDIPIDVQASPLPDDYDKLITENLDSKSFDPNPLQQPSDSDLDELALHLLSDDKPVLYVGNGVRIANAYSEFLDFLEQWPLACVTGWNSNDLLWDSHPCYTGRPGTVGNRSGNFAVQFSNCLLTVGCRLNIRQVSYNWHNFAPKAWKCQVDVDASELKKPTLSNDLSYITT